MPGKLPGCQANHFQSLPWLSATESSPLFIPKLGSGSLSPAGAQLGNHLGATVRPQCFAWEPQGLAINDVGGAIVSWGQISVILCWGSVEMSRFFESIFVFSWPRLLHVPNPKLCDVRRHHFLRNNIFCTPSWWHYRFFGGYINTDFNHFNVRLGRPFTISTLFQVWLAELHPRAVGPTWGQPWQLGSGGQWWPWICLVLWLSWMVLKLHFWVLLPKVELLIGMILYHPSYGVVFLVVVQRSSHESQVDDQWFVMFIDYKPAVPSYDSCSIGLILPVERVDGCWGSEATVVYLQSWVVSNQAHWTGRMRHGVAQHRMDTYISWWFWAITLVVTQWFDLYWDAFAFWMILYSQ